NRRSTGPSRPRAASTGSGGEDVRGRRRGASAKGTGWALQDRALPASPAGGYAPPHVHGRSRLVPRFASTAGPARTDAQRRRSARQRRGGDLAVGVAPARRRTCRGHPVDGAGGAAGGVYQSGGGARGGGGGAVAAGRAPSAGARRWGL